MNRKSPSPKGGAHGSLGVHFDTAPGWNTQRKAVQAKHEELIAHLRHATISEHQAIYAINCKIMPAMTYALQVAVLPKGLLEKWDATHRSIVRQKGQISKTTPPALFHLPKAEGGLGLASIEDAVNTLRIKMHCEAMNDVWHMDGGDEAAALQAKVVRAAEAHAQTKHTISHARTPHVQCLSAVWLSSTSKNANFRELARSDRETASLTMIALSDTRTSSRRCWWRHDTVQMPTTRP